MMSIEFWLGLLLAIPVGILTNIYTPKIEEFISKRNSHIARLRRIRLDKERKEIEYYSKNRSEFLEYLIVTILKAAFIGSVTTILSASLFTICSSSSGLYLFNPNLYKDPILPILRLSVFLLTLTARLVNLIGTIIFIIVVREAFTKFERIKHCNSKDIDSTITSNNLSNSSP